MTSVRSPRLDPARLDPSRGLERDGNDWTLFGLSLDPEAWLEADEATLAAIGAAWFSDDSWHRDDPGTHHGLVVGARAVVRALVRDGNEIRGRVWADLYGREGHYAVALMLEGARRVVVVDEWAPSPLTRRVLEAAGVEILIASVGDADDADLGDVDAVLALYSPDPRRLMLSHPAIRTGIVAPAYGPWRARIDRTTTQAADRPLAEHFRVRLARWPTRLEMSEGVCALLPEPVEVEMEIRERTSAHDVTDGGDHGGDPSRQWGPASDPRIATLPEASALLFAHLIREPRAEPPRVAPIEAPPVTTGFRLFDAGVGGVVPGHVHLVVSTVSDARTAVLAELAMTWPHQRATPSLLAGPGPTRRVLAAGLGASSGVAQTRLETGDLDPKHWRALAEMVEMGVLAGLPYRFAGGVHSARDLDASLANYKGRPPGVVAVDLCDLTVPGLEGWTELARARGIPIVIGLDARCPVAREHELPELLLTRLAASSTRLRLAVHGARANGSFSHRMIVDVDRDTLVVATYDPTREERDSEPPDDPDLLPAPETTWATREVT